jgi:predicted PurR-regulated permease PerM
MRLNILNVTDKIFFLNFVLLNTNMKAIITISLFAFFIFPALAQDINYTLADRDRLIQVEADIKALRNEMGSLRSEMGSLRNEMNSLRNEMNTNMQSVEKRFESMERTLVDVKTFLYWGFGILFSFMLFLVGFVVWDRRSTIKPVADDVETLKQENKKMKEIFRKQMEYQPQLREILKNAGIL